MRRKSQRGATKVTPEKPVETATRRSRRHSKRRKRSSSQSSNEESHETPPPPIESHQSKSPEQPPAITIPDEDTEEPVWKVKASAAPSGEIQKIKLCLTRPVLSSPEKTELPSKRRRNKSSSRIDEDVTSSEDVVVTPTRKSRHRGSSGIEFEEVEDKKGKGKSKSKNKSKHDKSQEIQEVKDETQNQISENIQVTPQSPQAASDIRVDNEIVSNNENDSINEDSNSQINTATQFSDSTIIKENKTADELTSTQHLNTQIIETSVTKSDDELESHTPTASVVDDTSDVQKIEESSEQVIQQNLEDQITESVSEEIQMETDQIDVKQIEETKIEELTSEQVKETDTHIEAPEVKENCTATVTEEGPSEKHVEVTEQKDAEVSDINECKDAEVAIASETKTEVQIVADQGEPKSGSTCSDEAVTEREDVEKPAPILEKMEVNEDSNQKATDEKQLFDEEAISVDTIINLNSTKNEDDAKEEIPSAKVIRKRKWGKSLVGLELTNISTNINIETIKELCPTLKFLEENEIQIEIKDRRKSSDADRTNSRKVSIEYKTNDKLETQTSVSSEISEPVEVEVDNSNIIAMNRKISIVDDTASKLKPPPSPARNPLSQVLYITNLVRPFTLKQLKELLERTGKITENGFWTDRIKSKCYVCYETVEEAEATRNALHGVHWPICNGKKLAIEYSSPEELDKARNPTPPPVVVQPIIPDKADIENQSPPKRARLEDEEKFKRERPVTKSEQHVREWDIGKEDLHRRRSRSRSPREVRNDRHERNDRRKYKRSLSPIEDVMNKKKLKEDDVPQKLMDDLFQRTKATPSIYWLPLTPEEIATKQQQRLLRMAEHKRRMEESSRSRGDYGRGVPYRRRYD